MLCPAHEAGVPFRARSISSRCGPARPESSPGSCRHTPASASKTGAYGHAPSTGAAVPWPARNPRSAARAAMAARSDDLPAPASPLMISVRFAPAAASSTARSAMDISRSRPISGLSRCRNTSCAASSRSRSAEASGPGATPSSCRSARSRRSNWRSAACRSPLAACRRIRARWARSSPGSSSATASHRPSRRSRSRWLWLSCSRRVSAHSSYLSAGSSSPPYSASASRAAAASPAASARRASVLELDRVHGHAAAGIQDDLIAAQHHRVRHADGAPGEVRRLVQLGHRLGDRVAGPDQVDDLLAMQPPPRRQREHLHHRRRVAALPAGLGDRDSADRHGEPAEQRDVDLRHQRPCRRRSVRTACAP